MLRDRPRDLHEEADAVLGDAPMGNVRTYGRMVRTTFEMTEAVISAVNAYLPLRPNSGVERGRVRLDADMAYLGMPCSVGSSSLEIGTRAEALGALYICEGSKLGTRVLARQVWRALRMNSAGRCSG
jgi:heme oxygenase